LQVLGIEPFVVAPPERGYPVLWVTCNALSVPFVGHGSGPF
jgi:hypothetical protein